MTEAIKDYETIMKDYSLKQIELLKNTKGFTEEQKETAKRYCGFLERKGIRLQTQSNYLRALKELFQVLGTKPLTEITGDDIDRYLARISEFKPKSQTLKRACLIMFFEWYYNKKKEHIPLISDIKSIRDRGIKLPEELLTPEEVKKLILVAKTFRDKAMIVLLYETACRRGEFLQLRIKHVEVTNKDYGFITVPMGKTDSRKIPIIYSLPHLQNWLNSHPLRDNPDAPLFVTQGSHLNRCLSADAMITVLKEAKNNSGLKKRMYPHIFRHSRLTELGKELKEQELKKFAGWTGSSDMARIYVHLSGEDVSNKILANAGLIDKSAIQKGKDNLLGIKCPRCDVVNPSDAKFCKCGFILDLREVNKMLEQKHKAETELSAFMDNEPMEKLFKMLYKMQKQIEDIKSTQQT